MILLLILSRCETAHGASSSPRMMLSSAENGTKMISDLSTWPARPSGQQYFATFLPHEARYWGLSNGAEAADFWQFAEDSDPRRLIWSWPQIRASTSTQRYRNVYLAFGRFHLQNAPSSRFTENCAAKPFPSARRAPKARR